jgi:hypothetical protein
MRLNVPVWRMGPPQSRDDVTTIAPQSPDDAPWSDDMALDDRQPWPFVTRSSAQTNATAAQRAVCRCAAHDGEGASDADECASQGL